MIHETDESLILLTYKGKVLLTLENDSPVRSASDIWSFIVGIKKSSESYEQAIRRRVERKTGIKLTEVELLSHWTYNQQKKYFFHANLTDKDVNSIQRQEGETIDFFSLKELEKLPLSRLTSLFIAKHRAILENTPQNTNHPLSA